MLKAIIFDFAGVVASEAYWDWLASNLSLDDKRRQYFNELSYKVDKGVISEAEFLGVLSKESGKAPEVIKVEILNLIKLQPQIIDLAKNLKKKYKVGMLTNYCKEWMYFLIEKHSLRSIFSVIVISSELGIIKPERGIYEETAKKLGVDMAACVFIDDRRANVDAASKYGMKAILYTSFDSLEKSLRTLGI